MQSNGVNSQSNGVNFSGWFLRVFKPISLRPSESQTACLDHAWEQTGCVDPLQTSNRLKSLKSLSEDHSKAF